MDKILEVNNLKVSFRAQGGKVKAVRDISFSLERGKTMAIVGESGSGKSVTSKAILGILAGNAIIEGGEILYAGKDLLTISEDEMYKIRGDKISMIFQDPLSSLNPIVKIGQQITEAMLLKNKVNRKEARADFNSRLAILKKNMIEAKVADEATINQICKDFDSFATLATELELPYNASLGLADELKGEIADFLFLVEKKQNPVVKKYVKDFLKKMTGVRNPFLETENAKNLEKAIADVNSAIGSYIKPKNGEDVVLPNDLKSALEFAEKVMEGILTQEQPNFFRIGFYKFKGNDVSLTNQTVKELNDKSLTYLDDNFMKQFLDYAAKGIQNSHDKSIEKKKALVADLEEAKKFYAGDIQKSEAEKYAKNLCAKIEDSIDPLEIQMDSLSYTFRTSITKGLQKYFMALEKNPKEEARFARQTAKREALIAKGKKVDWKVVPKSIMDEEELKNHILVVISRLLDSYKNDIATTSAFDASSKCVALIDFFKEKASQLVFKLTKAMAREKAIKLMEEVGIHEPRRRYYQYPFEFSGGMRQRIVIAIALAANPDILICDEPTTALDVTIQAQILELINKLKRDRNISVVFITHDLGVVANMADEIAVMYAGKIVEYGTADDIFYDPRHPYTWALLASMPDLDTNEKLDAIPGTPPNMIYPPVGDAFAARNKYAMQIDFEEQPPMFKVSDTHMAATWLLHPDAPKVEMPKIITDRIARMTSAGKED